MKVINEAKQKLENVSSDFKLDISFHFLFLFIFYILLCVWSWFKYLRIFLFVSHFVLSISNVHFRLIAIVVQVKN